jgi:hypothetical protein
MRANFLLMKMHSLSTNVFTDFYIENQRRLSGWGSSQFAELKECTRRQWLHWRNFARNCKIVVCAPQRNGNGGRAGSSLFLS